MNTYEVNADKTLKLTTKDLEDILCCCIEGGCNYWCQIDNSTDDYVETAARLRRFNNETPTIEEVIVAMWEDGKPLEVGEDANDDGTFSTPHTIYLSHFLKAIGQAIEDGYWDGGDICDIDGEIGDCIMQLACFEEVIYG